MDSSASLTAAGGVGMDRTSTRCCFLIDFTAGYCGLGDKEIRVDVEYRSWEVFVQRGGGRRIF